MLVVVAQGTVTRTCNDHLYKWEQARNIGLLNFSNDDALRPCGKDILPDCSGLVYNSYLMLPGVC
jgi:hypothetical protein